MAVVFQLIFKIDWNIENKEVRKMIDALPDWQPSAQRAVCLPWSA